MCLQEPGVCNCLVMLTSNLMFMYLQEPGVCNCLAMLTSNLMFMYLQEPGVCNCLAMLTSNLMITGGQVGQDVCMLGIYFFFKFI